MVASLYLILCLIGSQCSLNIAAVALANFGMFSMTLAARFWVINQIKLWQPIIYKTSPAQFTAVYLSQMDYHHLNDISQVFGTMKII